MPLEALRAFRMGRVASDMCALLSCTEADADMSDSVGFVEATSGRGIASGDVSMVEEVASMAASASAATVPDASAAVPPPAPSAEASAVAEAPSGEMSEAVDAAAPPVTPEPASGGAGADVVAPVAPTREKKKKRKKNRCATCRVKTGILGFVCRCDLNFCEKHRHPDDHECTFDAKAQHKAVLTKANNKVVAAKVDKI